MHILLIEDDLDLGASLVRSLQQDGFTVQWLRRAHDAPHCLHTRPVPRHTRQPPGLRPAPVAVHDDGDMSRVGRACLALTG